MVVRQKLFAANSVLKADDVNTYLRDITVVDTFAELASLDAAIYFAYVAGLGSTFAKVGGQWRKQSGYKSAIWQNGNIGSSGLVNVNQTANVISDSINAPYASDCGMFHLSVAVGAGSGSSIGSIQLLIADVNYTQVFNVGTSAVPVVIHAPFTCGPGVTPWQVNLSVGLGAPAGMAYSSARITI